jgi:hypothetical protein
MGILEGNKKSPLSSFSTPSPVSVVENGSDMIEYLQLTCLYMMSKFSSCYSDAWTCVEIFNNDKGRLFFD